MNRVSKVGSCLERSSIRVLLEKQNKIAEKSDDIIDDKQIMPKDADANGAYSIKTVAFLLSLRKV